MFVINRKRTGNFFRQGRVAYAHGATVVRRSRRSGLRVPGTKLGGGSANKNRGTPARDERAYRPNLSEWMEIYGKVFGIRVRSRQ
ncbi:hypothetical protein BG53_03890 [Paenibacillus darwinianus]|uniref:Uncharacterized protein n=1 Tax=Paenibacillus darwinianus TaxID=1380763 RepID=A0A9W5S1E7_9BACL|nr:hypothetical protein BG52_09295 [Paenibacillus darwinianus]EXX87609.1 hypothetical protein BG53_03890 [Paenibacillus darwinianus]EXX87669.1 hypothetical protein CH50_04960 [Paenibacillus darwinianus]